MHVELREVKGVERGAVNKGMQSTNVTPSPLSVTPWSVTPSRHQAAAPGSPHSTSRCIARCSACLVERGRVKRIVESREGTR